MRRVGVAVGRWTGAFLAVASLGGPWAACSDDEADAGTDVATTADSSVSETVVAETSVAETNVVETSAAETSVTETSAAETSVTETSATETSATETSVTETSVTETETSEEVADTDDASDSDTGPAPVVIVGTPNLVESGWSSGHCAGACVAKMTYAGAELSLQITGHDGTLHHAAVGILTTDAAGQLGNILEALAGQSLETRYGCPGCADGPVAHLTLTFEGGSVNTTYEKGDAPAVLTALDTLIGKATTALETCTGGDTVVITGTCPQDF